MTIGTLAAEIRRELPELDTVEIKMVNQAFVVWLWGDIYVPCGAKVHLSEYVTNEADWRRLKAQIAAICG